MNRESRDLITIKNLSKHYIVKKNIFAKKNLIKAVNDVSFEIKEGESLGLIGESGCGKSTTASLILNLIKADEGKIIYKNMDLTKINDDVMRGLRKELQIIFQASQGTLDPLMTIDELLKVPLRLHKIVDNSGLDSEVIRLLNLVELSESDKYKYPHQMSGGQRQRIGIARAIATRPSFIICDEPVSALDVSIQGQILNLLENLRKELKLTYLFISHDLKVVKHLCDRIAVMNSGKIVEIGQTMKILDKPKEEYTKKLISSQLFSS
ncbi:ATP-binding cassette domain-containing protein [Clostridium sp. 'White wine YQ']|uniref:ATP-binding cassette domain-containing protein n=1 Tax=Clostridium sp. 'White wine YQ' TaxID=3027474 RepID=UPI002365B9FB|nr:ATP-binding cassette domain-containing protein [Clostridium sp. 'White wine YQ']MDD7795147.1 ATP-binding cassette domain-containing protein [Clostridium sp. 'White wine YQ']